MRTVIGIWIVISGLYNFQRFKLLLIFLLSAIKMYLAVNHVLREIFSE